MKRISKMLIVIPFIFLLLLGGSALSELMTDSEDKSWAVQPVIVSAYELGQGKIYIRWTGNAELYGVYLDGEQRIATNVTNAILEVNNGAHSIIVIPLKKVKGQDIDVGLDVIKFGGNIKLSLPGGTQPGLASETIYYDYFPDPLFTTNIGKPQLYMNPDDTVSISFDDDYGCDEYIITVKNDKSVSYVKYYPKDSTRNKDIKIDDNKVNIKLDPSYLRDSQSMAIRLGQKYKFSVQMRKTATDVITKQNIPEILHLSRDSEESEFSPVAAWAVAPVISTLSQTGEGEITITWTHDPGNYSPISYEVIRENQVLGFSVKQDVLASVQANQVILHDLEDGDYSLKVIPRYEGKDGLVSEVVSYKVQNNWNMKPMLTIEKISPTSCRVSWPVAWGVETYHIKVFIADTGSVLSFVGLNYNLDKEFEHTIQPESETTDFIYVFEGEPASEIKLKFEIYGVHVTGDGKTQQTETAYENFTLTE